MSILAIITSAADAAEETAKGGLPQLDMSTYPSQIFWLAITFGVLYWILAGLVLPRLGGAIEERRDRIADDLDQAAELRRQAEEAEAAYNQALADARAKAQAIAAETRAEVETDIAALQAKATEETDAKVASAEARIAEMKADATAKVRDAAADVTRSIVSTLIDETPTDDAVASAVSSAVSSATSN